MRFVTLTKTATLTAYLASRPAASLASSVVVYGPDNSTLETITPTLGATSTTTTSSAAKGDRTLALTAVTGVSVGQRYLVAGTEAAGGEMVTVSSIASLVVTLTAPLRRAVASGATFVSTRLSVAITAASTARVQRDCRAEFTDPDSLDVVTIPFDVVRWTPRSELTTADLRSLDGQIAKRVPADLWLPDMIAEAWDRVCDDLATKDRVPGGYAGTIMLTRAHGYLVRAMLAETAGADFEKYRDDMRTRYVEERDVTLAAIGYDGSQTGVTKAGAGVWRGLQIQRG